MKVDLETPRNWEWARRVCADRLAPVLLSSHLLARLSIFGVNKHIKSSLPDLSHSLSLFLCSHNSIIALCYCCRFLCMSTSHPSIYRWCSVTLKAIAQQMRTLIVESRNEHIDTHSCKMHIFKVFPLNVLLIRACGRRGNIFKDYQLDFADEGKSPSSSSFSSSSIEN